MTTNGGAPSPTSLLPVLLLAALGSVTASAIATAAGGSAWELAGVWSATRDFGPEIRGPLELTRSEAGWRARVAGYSVEASTAGSIVELELSGGRGGFRGRLDSKTQRLLGHWIQPPTVNNGLRFASPVELLPAGSDSWLGQVTPWDDSLTFHLVLAPRQDGALGAFFRNPERNLGVFLNLDRLERSGDRVELLGTWLRNQDERLLAEGFYRGDFGRLSVFIPRGSGTYDFARIDTDPAHPFWARGETPGPYRYFPPPEFDDGWPVGTLEEAGISLEPLRRLLETEIFPAADSVHDPYVHGMLIARHGKLVFEEYFHGFDRWTPHETRSASKSLTSTLVGAAIKAGEPLSLTSPVYETVRAQAPPDEERGEHADRIEVEHLLTMSSGFDCDDADPTSPGAEDVMQEQTEEPDWYRYALALQTVREPGEVAVYCSINPNLLGLVLSEATGERLPLLFHRLIAEPLEVERYHLVLQPTGEPYLGGGIHWLPRDFMKLGQLYLDGGVWNGRRILSPEFASRAVSPLYELRERRYGYLWWVIDYPFRGGSVRAFYAGGNGGQVVIGIPELDLLIAFYAGNYNDRVMFRIQEEFVSEFILPAVAGIKE